MQWIAAFAAFVQIVAMSAIGWASPVWAGSSLGQSTVITTSWVEEWDPALQQWVRIDDAVEASSRRATPRSLERAEATRRAAVTSSAARFTARLSRQAHKRPLAQYGPFLVLDEHRVAMMGSTDGSSPRHFDAMMRDYPALTTLEMVEAPGTSNDIANLAVGRRIRAHGISTYVPSHGSVRSGAVELFLAGVQQCVEPGAWIAVHSWIDNHGREPDDYGPDHAANRLYLDYYVEMGMSEADARAFYAMTNSVPHRSAKWLRADEMLPWTAPRLRKVKPERTPAGRSKLAYSNLRDARWQPSIGYSDVASVALASLRMDLSKPFLDS